jgi:hypothetical protein
VPYEHNRHLSVSDARQGHRPRSIVSISSDGSSSDSLYVPVSHQDHSPSRISISSDKPTPENIELASLRREVTRLSAELAVANEEANRSKVERGNLLGRLEAISYVLQCSALHKYYLQDHQRRIW